MTGCRITQCKNHRKIVNQQQLTHGIGLHRCWMREVLLYTYFWFFVGLFGVLGPTREFFTHMETSPLQVKG